MRCIGVQQRKHGPSATRFKLCTQEEGALHASGYFEVVADPRCDRNAWHYAADLRDEVCILRQEIVVRVFPHTQADLGVSRDRTCLEHQRHLQDRVAGCTSFEGLQPHKVRGLRPCDPSIGCSIVEHVHVLRMGSTCAECDPADSA